MGGCVGGGGWVRMITGGQLQSSSCAPMLIWYSGILICSIFGWCAESPKAMASGDETSGHLAWQEEHLQLVVDGGTGRGHVFSSATSECAALPPQQGGGSWILSFHEGMGVVSYEVDGDDSAEPLFQDWAQNLLTYRAYKSGGQVLVVGPSCERIPGEDFLQMHDHVQVGIASTAMQQTCFWDLYVFHHAKAGFRLWWSLRDLSKHFHLKRQARGSVSAALYDRMRTWSQCRSSTRLCCS